MLIVYGYHEDNDRLSILLALSAQTIISHPIIVNWLLNTLASCTLRMIPLIKQSYQAKLWVQCSHPNTALLLDCVLVSDIETEHRITLVNDRQSNNLLLYTKQQLKSSWPLRITDTLFLSSVIFEIDWYVTDSIQLYRQYVFLSNERWHCKDIR
jgi:hypothetical protein